MQLTDDEVRGIIRALDTPCWQCGRRGQRATPSLDWIGREDNEQICGICNGAGYQLADAGEQLLAFLRRWFVHTP